MNRFSRRDIVRMGLFGAAASFSLPAFLRAAAEKKVPVSLQLYSLRREMPKDVPGILAAVAKMGYKGVEFAGYHGWEKKPADLKKLLDDNGLICSGTHTGLGMLEGDKLKSTIELHQALGCKFPICPGMNGKTVQGWKDLAKKFTDIAAKLKEVGMFTGYHAHGGDFKKIDGQIPWDIFFDNTPADIVQQIDTGNALGGGVDPIAYVKKYPGRSKTVHLKAHGAGDAPIGEDKVDWKAFFEACESVGGTEWYVVEHESGNQALKSVEACIVNLRKMGKC